MKEIEQFVFPFYSQIQCAFPKAAPDGEAVEIAYEMNNKKIDLEIAKIRQEQSDQIIHGVLLQCNPREVDDGVDYEAAELVTPSTIVIEETSLQNEIV